MIQKPFPAAATWRSSQNSQCAARSRSQGRRQSSALGQQTPFQAQRSHTISRVSLQTAAASPTQQLPSHTSSRLCPVQTGSASRYCSATLNYGNRCLATGRFAKTQPSSNHFPTHAQSQPQRLQSTQSQRRPPGPQLPHSPQRARCTKTRPTQRVRPSLPRSQSLQPATPLQTHRGSARWIQRPTTTTDRQTGAREQHRCSALDLIAMPKSS